MNTKTENGSLAYSSTLNAVLDAFFAFVRGLEEEKIKQLLTTAWLESPLDTLILIFQTRDCRGGKGERSLFRTCLLWLAEHHPDHLIHNMELIPFFGRWDDLLILFDLPQTSVAERAVAIFAEQLKRDRATLEKKQKQGEEGKKEEEEEENCSLAAKWAPRENGKWDKQLGAAKKLRDALNVNRADYRKKFIAPLREHLKVVERDICAKEYENIRYQGVPSLAMNRYRKLFQEKDEQRFSSFLEKVKKGEATINASTVDPYTLVDQYMKAKPDEVDDVLEAQWNEIYKRVKGLGSFDRALVMSDVSGSMGGDAAMPVSVAMGILISQLSKHYHGDVLTFESTPHWHKLNHNTSLRERVSSLLKAPWGGSTNFNKAIGMILEKAKQKAIPPSEMPNMLFVISDMQFNQAQGYGKQTNLDVYKKQYEEAGYEYPTIIFWNVRANTTAKPAQANAKNVALISGYSPSLMKSVMEGADITPMGVLRNILDDKRYETIKLDPKSKDLPDAMKDEEEEEDDEEEEEDNDA